MLITNSKQNLGLILSLGSIVTELITANNNNIKQ